MSTQQPAASKSAAGAAGAAGAAVAVVAPSLTRFTVQNESEHPCFYIALLNFLKILGRGSLQKQSSSHTAQWDSGMWECCSSWVVLRCA